MKPSKGPTMRIKIITLQNQMLYIHDVYIFSSDESTFHSMKGIPIDKLIEDYFKVCICCKFFNFMIAINHGVYDNILVLQLITIS